MLFNVFINSICHILRKCEVVATIFIKLICCQGNSIKACCCNVYFSYSVFNTFLEGFW